VRRRVDAMRMSVRMEKAIGRKVGREERERFECEGPIIQLGSKGTSLYASVADAERTSLESG
jgi:hypothetical protein